jgi:hypothetical protein
MAHHCIRAVGEPAGSGEINKVIAITGWQDNFNVPVTI